MARRYSSYKLRTTEESIADLEKHIRMLKQELVVLQQAEGQYAEDSRLALIADAEFSLKDYEHLLACFLRKQANEQAATIA